MKWKPRPKEGARRPKTKKTTSNLVKWEGFDYCFLQVQ